MLWVRKVGFFIALKFDTRIKFSNKFLTISLVLLLPSLSTTLLLLVLNTFGANSLNNLVVFNKEINNIAILLKFSIKHQ